jgi:thymidylate kinase
MRESRLAECVVSAYGDGMRRRSTAGRLVVVAGVDGAGKTTQVTAVRDELRRKGVRVETIWGRWDPLLAKPAVLLLDRMSARRATGGPATSDAARRGIKRRLLAFAPVRSAWLVLMVLDYAVRLAPRVRRAKRRADLLLLDRYWLDVLIDFSAGGELADPPRALTWFLPSATRVFVLDLPEAVASARSDGVHDNTYLAQRRALYREAVNRGQAVAVDASRERQEVTADLLNQIEAVVRSSHQRV